MARWILAAVSVVVLSAVIAIANSYLSEARDRRPYDPVAAELASQIDQQYEPVPLVRLLAVPERYDGRKVRVQGFVTLHFEGNALHLDENAYKAGLRKSAIYLDRPRWLAAEGAHRLDLRYGEVAGTFVGSEHGGDYGHSGSLTKLIRIQPTYTHSDWVSARARERDEVLRMTLLSGPFLTLVGWSGLLVLWVLTRRGGQP